MKWTVTWDLHLNDTRYWLSWAIKTDLCRSMPYGASQAILYLMAEFISSRIWKYNTSLWNGIKDCCHFYKNYNRFWWYDNNDINNDCNIITNTITIIIKIIIIIIIIRKVIGIINIIIPKGKAYKETEKCYIGFWKNLQKQIIGNSKSWMKCKK